MNYDRTRMHEIDRYHDIYKNLWIRYEEKPFLVFNSKYGWGIFDRNRGLIKITVSP